MKSVKVVKANGHGQSQCRRCKEKGIYNIDWTSFMYAVEGLDGYYCSDCVKAIRNCEQMIE